MPIPEKIKTKKDLSLAISEIVGEFYESTGVIVDSISFKWLIDQYAKDADPFNYRGQIVQITMEMS